MSKEKNDIDNTTNEDNTNDQVDLQTKIIQDPMIKELTQAILIDIEGKISQCIIDTFSSTLGKIIREDVLEIKRNLIDVTRVVEEKSNSWGNNVEAHVTKLENVAQKLNEENFMLRKLPEKMQEGLRAIVPEVGKEIQTIHTDLLTAFNDNIKICHDNLKLLADEAQKFITKQQELATTAMDQLVEKSTRISKLCIQKTWITMLVVTVVSAIISAAGCYFTLASMPSPYDVTIDQAKNIYIDKSPVAIWGDKGLNIYKPEKK